MSTKSTPQTTPSPTKLDITPLSPSPNITPNMLTSTSILQSHNKALIILSYIGFCLGLVGMILQGVYTLFFGVDIPTMSVLGAYNIIYILV